MKLCAKVVFSLMLSMGASAAMADTMSCYVDTTAYDEYRTNSCFAMVWNANTATAVFKVDDAPSGSKILLSNTNCSQTSSVCNTSISANQAYTMSATVLKPDGTWFEADASAVFSDGR